MAEETQKELILSLKFDTTEALKRSGDFRESIDKDKESLAALNKEIKASQEVSQEQLLQREKLEQAIRENTKARQNELRQVDAYVKATKNATDENGKYNGSINQLRGALSIMSAKWNDLTKEERENAEVGGVLRAETKRLSDQLKELEGSVGDNRRSVGGYLDAIRQAPGAMGKFKAGLDGIGIAMKSNPLGLLVSLLPQIAAAFNTSGEGADFFAKAMTIVNAVVQEGVKRLVTLAGAAVKLISGDFKGAVNDGKAALTGFVDSIDKAVKSGGSLADRMDALENAESRFTVTSAKAKKQIDELLIQARNRTTSEGERIKLLEKAEKLEVQVNQQALKLARERLALIEAENKIKQGDEDEEIKRVNEQQAKIIELENQSANIQEKIQNRKDQLADAAAAREAKRQEDRVKAFEKNRELLIKEVEGFQKLADSLSEIRAKQLEEEKKIRDEFKKGIDDQFKASEIARQKDLKDQQAVAAEEKRLSDQNVAVKEAEFQVISSLAIAASNLTALLANESSEAAEFQKVLTLFQISIDAAKAISKLTASATEVAAAVAATSGPAGVVTGPLAYASYYGTQIVALTSSFLQAKQLLTGDAPKFKAADGGLLSGPSHAEGGIQGTGRFANVEVEGGEAIINKRSTAMFAPILSAINQIGGGNPLMPTYYGAAGGYMPSVVKSATLGMNSSPAIDYNQLAKAVAKQPIYVIPTEIRDKANAADSRKVRAGLGY